MNGQDLIQNGRIYLDGDVMPDMWVQWDGTGISARVVREALAQFPGDVTIVVNSPGGAAMEGEAIRAAIAAHPGRVTVQVAGQAMSAASLMIMSADRIEMTAGSILMIHDPSTCVCGTAEELRAAADATDSIADVYARVYAARAGVSVEAARSLMRTEVYYGPEEAIAAGFCDAIVAEALAALPDRPIAARAALAAFALSQERLRMRAERIAGGQPAPAEMAGSAGLNQAPAGAAAQEADMPNDQTTPAAPTPDTQAQAPAAPEPTMAAPTGGSRLSLGEAEMRNAQSVAAERTRIREITDRAAPFMAAGSLTQADVNAAIDEGLSVSDACARFMTRMAAVDAQAPVSRSAARVTRDSRDTMRAGMTEALVTRMSRRREPADDRARPYMDLGIVEMAAEAAGIPAPRSNSFVQREQVLMQAMHSTSDFPNILGNSVNRMLEAQYEEIVPTYAPISREMRFNDFRQHTVVSAGNFPGLEKINENGEIKFGTVGEAAEQLALLSYARGIRVSRQALVNDDLGAFDAVLEVAGSMIPENEERLFWAAFLGNPTMSDGVALFHADHGNLAGSGAAITVASLALGRAALRKQKGVDGNPIPMNGPEFLVVGPDKETEAEKLLSDVRSTKADDVNPFSGRLRLLVSEQITGNQWYLAVGNTKRTHVMKHGYLDGQRAPRIRIEEPFGLQGMGVTLEHDFGVGAVNWRGAYKNPGA